MKFVQLQINLMIACSVCTIIFVINVTIQIYYPSYRKLVVGYYLNAIFLAGYLVFGWIMNWIFAFKNWTIARQMPKLLSKAGMLDKD